MFDISKWWSGSEIKSFLTFDFRQLHCFRSIRDNQGNE